MHKHEPTASVARAAIGGDEGAHIRRAHVAETGAVDDHGVRPGAFDATQQRAPQRDRIDVGVERDVDVVVQWDIEHRDSADHAVRSDNRSGGQGVARLRQLGAGRTRLDPRPPPAGSSHGSR